MGLHGKARWIAVVALAMASAFAATAQDLSPERWLKTGDSHLAHRRYSEALAAYRHARETDNADLRVQAGVGATRSLLRAGRYAEAAGFARRSDGARSGEMPPTMASQADVLWTSGFFPEAEERYAAALARDPALPAALHGLGRSLAAQGQLTEAEAQVASAAAGEPTDPLNWMTLGTIYERQWRYRTRWARTGNRSRCCRRARGTTRRDARANAATFSRRLAPTARASPRAVTTSMKFRFASRTVASWSRAS
jgi:tetratricopeptide (TPR) repeat protein